MADNLPVENNDVKDQSTEKTKEVKNKKGSPAANVFTGFLAFLIALVVIGGVVTGLFYIVVNNNVNGIADKYRKEINAIPVLRSALPKIQDPDDPKFLTDEEIKKRYNALRTEKKVLLSTVESANKKINSLNSVKAENIKIVKDNQMSMKDLADERAKLNQYRTELETDKVKIDELIANGDKVGFKAYFEKMDKEGAKKIYAQTIKEDATNVEAIKFTKVYESMDPSATAPILETLSSSNMDLVVGILKNLKKEVAAEILAAMNSKTAAQITEKISANLFKVN